MRKKEKMYELDPILTCDLLAKKGKAARLQKMPETGISTLYAINSGRMPGASCLMEISLFLRCILGIVVCTFTWNDGKKRLVEGTASLLDRRGKVRIYI